MRNFSAPRARRVERCQIVSVARQRLSRRRRWLAVAICLCGLPAIGRPASAADELRYRLTVGEEIAYSFTVSAKSDSFSGNWSGTNRLRVDALPAIPLAENAKPNQATGTGFFVTADGYLLTCAHVVRGAIKIEVAVGDKKYDARVISQDRDHDVALLRIDATGLPALPLGDSAAVELGQEVRAIGYPFSDLLGESIKVVRGTIAGIIDRPDGKLLQVDAGINPGNSGGPMVNEQGQVVGVVSAKMTMHKASNVGFVQPIDVAKPLLVARKIAFQSAGADGKLEGPALAKRVIPSVVLVTVTLRPILESIRLLAYRGVITEQIQGSAPRAGAVDDGHMLIDSYGDILLSDFDRTLPACLGAVGRVGIEEFSDEGRKKWASERIVMISRSDTSSIPLSTASGTAAVAPSDAAPFGRSRLRAGWRSRSAPAVQPPKQTVVVQPAIDRTHCEITATTSDAIEIKKTCEVTSLAQQGSAEYLSLAGKSTLKVDPRTGVPETLEFEGTLTTGKDTIEIKYAYHRVDPASIDNTGPPPTKYLATAKTSPAANPPQAAGGDKVAGADRAAGQPNAWRGRRPDVPAAPQLAKVLRLVDEMFESEISAAKTQPQKLGLAKLLVEHARRQKAGGPDRYGALEKARDLAAAAGDVKFSAQIIAEMSAGYRADVAGLRMSSLQMLSQSVSAADEQGPVVEFALLTIDDAIRSGQLEGAQRSREAALTAARKAKDDKLVERVNQRSAELGAAQQAFSQYQAAQNKLKDDPKNAAANTIVGKYECLVRGEWDAGLPHLALADDPQLHDLAEKELAGPTDSEGQLELADAWWELGQHQDNLRKANLQAHARKWYALVLDDLTGESRTRAEQRLAAPAE